MTLSPDRWIDSEAIDRLNVVFSAPLPKPCHIKLYFHSCSSSSSSRGSAAYRTFMLLTPALDRHAISSALSIERSERIATRMKQVRITLRLSTDCSINSHPSIPVVCTHTQAAWRLAVPFDEKTNVRVYTVQTQMSADVIPDRPALNADHASDTASRSAR